jgi:hypothetical protein
MPKKACESSPFLMFQKLAEINLIFSDNDYVLYIYLLTMQYMYTVEPTPNQSDIVESERDP